MWRKCDVWRKLVPDKENTTTFPAERRPFFHAFDIFFQNRQGSLASQNNKKESLVMQSDKKKKLWRKCDVRRKLVARNENTTTFPAERRPFFHVFDIFFQNRQGSLVSKNKV